MHIWLCSSKGLNGIQALLVAGSSPATAKTKTHKKSGRVAPVEVEILLCLQIPIQTFGEVTCQMTSRGG